MPTPCPLSWPTLRRAALLAPAALTTWAGLLASPAQAGLVTYTDAASFTALLAPGYYLENTWTGAHGTRSSPFSGPSPANTFGMDFTAPGPGTNVLWVGTNLIGAENSLDALLLTLSGQPTLFGADAWGTDTSDIPIAGDITVVATTNLDATATLVRSKDDRFAGFATTTAGEYITQVRLSNTVTTSPYLWSNLTNAYVGKTNWVSTQVTPAGAGTLACPPAAVGATSTCTASSNAGYRTQTISGCGGTATVAGVNSYTTGALAGACTVTATFEKLSYAITASPTPAQAATAGGSMSCTPNPVEHDSTATCTATPEPGHILSEWGGDCAATAASSPTCSLSTVQAEHTVSAQFSVVQTTFSGSTVPSAGTDSGTATASFTGGSATCRFDAANTAFVTAPPELPAGQRMPHGMLQFKLVGCDTTPVAMAITWPEAVQGLSKWGQASAGGAPSHFQPTDASASGHTTQFTVQDGQLGDDDWTVNGEIVDPVGATVTASAAPSVAPVPTLGPWALAGLALLAATLGAGQWRRLTRQS